MTARVLGLLLALVCAACAGRDPIRVAPPAPSEGAATITVREPEPLRASSPQDTTVPPLRWHAVEGVVHDRDGRPVALAKVSAATSEDARPLVRYADDAGRFAFTRVPAGAVRLTAEPSEGVLSGPSLPPGKDPGRMVTAGDREVVLVVDVGLELAVSLEGPPPERRPYSDLPGPLAVLWREIDGGVYASAQTFVRDGVARFRGLQADTSYVLWLPPDAEGEIVYERDVRAGPLVVKRRPGQTITVEVNAPAGTTSVQVNVQGPHVTFTMRRVEPPDGPVVVTGVPEGTWRLFVHAQVGTSTWLGFGTASSGSTVALDLQPAPVPESGER